MFIFNFSLARWKFDAKLKGRTVACTNRWFFFSRFREFAGAEVSMINARINSRRSRCEIKGFVANCRLALLRNWSVYWRNNFGCRLSWNTCFSIYMPFYIIFHRSRSTLRLIFHWYDRLSNIPCNDLFIIYNLFLSEQEFRRGLYEEYSTSKSFGKDPTLISAEKFSTTLFPLENNRQDRFPRKKRILSHAT